VRLYRALAVAVVQLCTACGELTYSSSPVRVARVVVAPASLRLQVGGQTSMQIEVMDAGGGRLSNRAVSVAVDDPRVAVAGGSNDIRALSEGSTSVRYASEGVTAVVPVTVISAATRLVLSQARTSIYLSDTLTVTAAAFDATGRQVSAQNVRWISLNAGIATVSPSGTVRGSSVGRASIVAQLGDLQASIEISVSDPLYSIRIEPSPSSLALGDSVQLSAVAIDWWGIPLAGRRFEWRATFPSRLDVNTTGLATARGLGWGDLLITSGAVAKYVTIQVAPQPLTFVVVTPTTATLRVGDHLQLGITLAARNGRPTTTDGRYVRWSASGFPVSVDNSGVVTAWSLTPGSNVCAYVDDTYACATIVIR
jgi:uncharacterized protein YjdB